jgi:hypothetical protein
VNPERANSISKRGRAGEGRPTKRTPEVVAKIAEAVATGLTDEEASLVAGINPDTMTEWRTDPEFSGESLRGLRRATLPDMAEVIHRYQGRAGSAAEKQGKTRKQKLDAELVQERAGAEGHRPALDGPA